MELGLAGKTVVVTGAGSGIGAATAQLFAAEGAILALIDKDVEAVEALARELDCIALAGDLGRAAGVDQTFGALAAQLSHVDILINNVGICMAGAFDDIDDERWERTFATNFMSAVRACRHVLPGMRERKSGVIVNNASDLARQPEGGFCDYQASKSALLSLTKSLALSEGPHIRVNAVAPGPIWTPLWTKPGGFAETLGEQYGLEPRAAVDAEMANRQLPLGRMGTPEEVASVIAFLASSHASFVTSAVWGVDGGTIRNLL